MASKKEESGIKFEKGLEQLEEIVQALESGDAELEVALKKFEKGVQITQELQKKLEASQRKVKKLLAGDSGPQEEDLDPEAAPSKKGGQDSLF